MSGKHVSGTEGYAAEAKDLLCRYEAMRFEDVHKSILHLFPTTPGRIFDIGSGTGRDAAAFAEMGHSVVAVEPTDELRIPAASLHPSPLIEWIAGSLPTLATVQRYHGAFGLIMLTAVWMHLDEGQRSVAMKEVSKFLKVNGKMIILLRHGPVPPGRRMYEVTAEETIELAQCSDMKVLLNLRESSLQAANQLSEVSWTRLVFIKL